jgi:hypothetical protein
MKNKLAFVLMFGALVACKKEEPAPAPPEQAAPVAPPAQSSTMPAAVAAEPPIDLGSVPVEEDFEEEAEKDITASNVEKKVDELEKEMSAE